MIKITLHIFVVISLVVWGCASLREPERPAHPQTERKDPLYRWSSFFNNDCGPMLQFKLNSEDEATLNYQCSAGKAVNQVARRLKRLREVDLWAASDLPLEQLYQLSNSKCRASLIYIGLVHATIEFPCALIHMTVTYDIVSREKIDDVTLVQLEPRKALITYGDGTQEFSVEEERLTPLGPFKPFRKPRPLFTHDLKQNRPLTNSQF
jgi:hypothetical protein